MIKIRAQQKFGIGVPSDLAIEWKPLRILSAEQEENVKNSKIQSIAFSSRVLGQITTEDFKDGCNRDNLLSVKVDATVGSIGDSTPDEEIEEGEETGSGASKESAKKSIYS